MVGVKRNEMIILKPKNIALPAILDELFDIYCHDGTQRHALERQHGFRMTKKYQVDSGADASRALALLST